MRHTSIEFGFSSCLSLPNQQTQPLLSLWPSAAMGESRAYDDLALGLQAERIALLPAPPPIVGHGSALAGKQLILVEFSASSDQNSLKRYQQISQHLHLVLPRECA